MPTIETDGREQTTRVNDILEVLNDIDNAQKEENGVGPLSNTQLGKVLIMKSLNQERFLEAREVMTTRGIEIVEDFERTQLGSDLRWIGETLEAIGRLKPDKIRKINP